MVCPVNNDNLMGHFVKVVTPDCIWGYDPRTHKQCGLRLSINGVNEWNRWAGGNGVQAHLYTSGVWYEIDVEFWPPVGVYLVGDIKEVRPERVGNGSLLDMKFQPTGRVLAGQPHMNVSCLMRDIIIRLFGSKFQGVPKRDMDKVREHAIECEIEMQGMQGCSRKDVENMMPIYMRSLKI